MNLESPDSNGSVLVLIETSANQHYLFKTNKLRENVGASQLTRMVGRWVEDAAPAAGGDVLMATSGKALVRVPSREDGRVLVGRVTTKALTEAPGLQVTGAMVPLENDHRAAIHEIHERFNRNRNAMGSIRAPVLPWTLPCASSGAPSVELRGSGGTEKPLSAESIAKLGNVRSWRKHIRRRMLGRGRARQRTQLFIPDNIDDLQDYFDNTQWMGVVYADGNGLGQIFMDLDTHLETLRGQGGPDLTAFEALSRISSELDDAAENAFYTACEHLHWLGATKAFQARFRDWAKRRIHVPVIPLVLAGDDLAVVVEGEYALPFARTFLRELERETEKAETISRVAEVALGARRLSAGAGIALVKHHFPFHLAQQLAADLLQSAKQVKQAVRRPSAPGGDRPPYPASALDFHVLLDASYTDLEAIREKRMKTPDGDRLYGGPYVITPMDQLTGTDEAGRQWAKEHHFDHLVRRFEALNARDEESDRAKLPRSQTHTLREAASQGVAIADARLREMRWLDERGLGSLIEPGNSLFLDRGTHCATRFVDAVNGAGFWPRPPGDDEAAVPAEPGRNEEALHD